MDDVDIANDRAQNDLDYRIAEARRLAPTQTGAEECRCCDEPIPLARRQLGYSLCLPCAAEEERRRAGFVVAI
ncbi:MAG TPA: hypothetical protein VFH22_01855 [Rhodocyclaceae bacterium]|nr:hypothetical protein [Rhodocyclaceae bacterium]